MNFQEWQQDLKSLQKLTRELQRSLNKIGGANDTQSFRSGMKTKQDEGSDIVNRMAKRTNEYKRKSMTSRDGDKLIKQYNELKTSFENVSNDINVKSRQFTPVQDNNSSDAGAVYGSDNNSNAYGGGDQQQQQELQPVSGEALSAVALAEERNKQVTKIAQDVVEIKEAFDDLNELVDDQQQHLDTIETNVVQAKDQVEAGTEQLKIAEKHQISARKKMCAALVCLLVIVGILLAVFLPQ